MIKKSKGNFGLLVETEDKTIAEYKLDLLNANWRDMWIINSCLYITPAAVIIPTN